ncbi:HutD family protein [Streptomyces sp. A3M-1-3]|uniref:HutD/Ves family protein n=1 Tax=Streptomyces sp. A3M-1-3 TaxID=2962044 RepID=UPI0020B63DBD|nr:HutD family protein [Streptomyces sp. A3M-1-3]MCP3817288.1 HutD family protein [Streptomyces sp. A3M-1-3]
MAGVPTTAGPAGRPLTVRVLRAADRTAVPWKNGGGVTRGIAAWPEGAGMDGFAWRVSLAEVGADGPYSAFPDIERTLTMVEGAGMDLTVGGQRRRVDERYVPQDFAGDEPTGCRLLGGPVANFNVMYRRGRAQAETSVVRGRLRLAVPPGGTVLAVVLEGTAVLEGAGARVELGLYDAVMVTGESRGGSSGESPGVLRTEGRAAVVTLRTR